VSVEAAGVREMFSWRLRDDRSAYDSEQIETAARSTGS